jgi:hypothetical protein
MIIRNHVNKSAISNVKALLTSYHWWHILRSLRFITARWIPTFTNRFNTTSSAPFIRNYTTRFRNLARFTIHMKIKATPGSHNNKAQSIPEILNIPEKIGFPILRRNRTIPDAIPHV